ncbi:MAG: hypothetical protein LBH36_02905 [Candidatus Nomurabacteria bacterium]|jgi:hypothetical protein|nr:hypothetical protein [Candidatus Nomurabacteria bacterium]
MPSSRRIINRVAEKISSYNNLVLLVVVTLTVTMVLLSISILLYRASGTAQLDLSRPGYENARDKSEVVRADEFDSTGPINDKTLKNFESMYDSRASKIKSVDAFRSEALSNEAFNIAD